MLPDIGLTPAGGLVKVGLLSTPAPSPEDIFRSFYRIRRVEEEVARVYPSDKIQSPIHLSIGQELASVAVCSALERTDKAFGSYRSHALYLAKGGDLKAFVAELYGKATGCARGKGGSMHLVEASAGLLGTSAIVGSLIPVAVGYAWAQKQLGSGVVTACFFGDGAAEEGAFFESLNFAALHNLPLLFVCENNGYAIHTPIAERQSSSIERRARAFGLLAGAPFTYEQTFAWAQVFVDAIRRGEGPALLELAAPRLKEHVGIAEDWAQGYRTEADARRHWRDPVDVAVSGVAGQAGAGLDPAAPNTHVPGIDGTYAIAGVSVSAAARVRAEVETEIAEAFAFAEASAVPGPHELLEHLYG